MKQMALDAALEVRRESDLRIKVGACLIKGNKIIGLAANRSGGTAKVNGVWSRHAELRCTINRNCEGGTLYVARTKGLGESLGLAKPCGACLDYLATLNLKAVYFTTDDGVEMMRLN